MNPDGTSIGRGSRIALHLEIRLDDGSIALSTFDAEPLDLVVGDGTLPPALEARLMGLSSGAEEDFSANGSDLYGTAVPEKLHWLSRERFPEDISLETGQVIAFDTPEGQETAGTVVELEPDRVRIDFNHPLSGRPLRIHAIVLSVKSSWT
jgi:FKBP-type peptidyl-prolyl cis-trans isomerase SlpA